MTSTGAVWTLAGSGLAAYADGLGSAASFNSPSGVSCDPATGGLTTIYVAGECRLGWAPAPAACSQASVIGEAYPPPSPSPFADTGNDRLRAVTRGGAVSLYAGTGASGTNNGGVLFATFNSPSRFVFSTVTAFSYVVDTDSFQIRRLTCPAAFTPSPSPSLVAGASPSVTPTPTPPTTPSATSGPSSVPVAAACTISVFAGSPGATGNADGRGAVATFRNPFSLSFDAAGVNLLVCDVSNGRLRLIAPDGLVSTFAGGGAVPRADGVGTSSSFVEPADAALVPGPTNALGAGNWVIAERGAHRLRLVTPGAVVTTLAGAGSAGFTDGVSFLAQFNLPSGVAVDTAGRVFVADTCVRGWR